MIEMVRFDVRAYELALDQARAERGLNLAISFDPQKHPRDAKGQFREVLSRLTTGRSVKLPDGTTVSKGSSMFFITKDGGELRGGKSDNDIDPTVAATKAFNISTAEGTGGRASPASPDRTAGRETRRMRFTRPVTGPIGRPMTSAGVMGSVPPPEVTNPRREQWYREMAARESDPDRKALYEHSAESFALSKGGSRDPRLTDTQYTVEGWIRDHMFHQRRTDRAETLAWLIENNFVPAGYRSPRDAR